MIQYQNYQPMATLSPVNFSITNLIYLFSGIKKFMITHEWKAAIIDPNVTSAISILMIITLILTIVLKASKLTKNESFLLVLLVIILSPGTSFHYYLVILLPTVYFAIQGRISNFFIIKNELNDGTTLKRNYKEFQVHGYSKKIGFLSILILCPPWTIPFKVLAFKNQLDLPEISAHWLLGQIMLILLFASLLFRTSNRGKSAESKFSKTNND